MRTTSIVKHWIIVGFFIGVDRSIGESLETVTRPEASMDEDLTRSVTDVDRLDSVAPISKISEPNPDSVLEKMHSELRTDGSTLADDRYLFSLMYELEVGEIFVVDGCRVTERIKLGKERSVFNGDFDLDLPEKQIHFLA